MKPIKQVIEVVTSLPAGLVQMVLWEVENAKAKHGDDTWPTDLIHAAAIVSEESGELIRECVNVIYENGKVENVEKEAMHTAVVALRFLENSNNYNFPL